MNRTALFVGASGLIGRQVIKDVLKNGDYTKIISIGRSLSKFDEDVMQENLSTLKKLKIILTILETDVFFCLGISPYVTDTEEEFLKIDRDYVRNTEKVIANANKVQNEELISVHFLYCSAKKADKNFSLLLLKNKGENEEYLSNLRFERISVFHIPFVKVKEQREKPRLIESIFEFVVGPVDWLFNLKVFVSSDVIGRAFRRVAADRSIKPLDPSSISELNSGSVTYKFSGADMLEMEAKAKK